MSALRRLFRRFRRRPAAAAPDDLWRAITNRDAAPVPFHALFPHGFSAPAPDWRTMNPLLIGRPTGVPAEDPASGALVQPLEVITAESDPELFDLLTRALDHGSAISDIDEDGVRQTRELD